MTQKTREREKKRSYQSYSQNPRSGKDWHFVVKLQGENPEKDSTFQKWIV